MAVQENHSVDDLFLLTVIENIHYPKAKKLDRMNMPFSLTCLDPQFKINLLCIFTTKGPTSISGSLEE